MYFSIEFSAKGYWIILVIVRVVWSIYFPFKHSTNFDGILLSQFPFRRLSVELKDRLKLRSNNLPDRKGAREIWIWSDVRNFCHCQIFDAFAYQLWIFTSTLRADSACVNLTPAIVWPRKVGGSQRFRWPLSYSTQSLFIILTDVSLF